jgi:hypothetical protein
MFFVIKPGSLEKALRLVRIERPANLLPSHVLLINNGKADRGRHGPLPYICQQVNILFGCEYNRHNSSICDAQVELNNDTEHNFMIL